MSEKKNIQEELEDLNSPILAQWQGKSAEWSVPEGYLDTLVNELVEKSEQPTKFKLFTLINKKLWQIAAGFLFLITASWFFVNNMQEEKLDTLATLDTISTEEIQDYVLDNIDEFDVEMLEEFAFENNGQFEEEDIWLEDQLDVDLF